MNQTKETIEEIVVKVISQKLGLPAESIQPDSFFYEDLNVSKLEMADIIQMLEEKLEIKFEIEAVKNFQKVADLIDYLYENIE